MAMEHSHWSEQLADEVAREKKEPYVISGGMTTSGPTHLGTVCEFFYPYSIKKQLITKGKKAEFYFVADILDAFDSVPVGCPDWLNEHLGKPLCNVPYKGTSFGEYYLQDAIAVMKELGVFEHVKIERANELYKAGVFDYYARLYIGQEKKVREIIEATSMRKLPDEWSIIMPICKSCGRIATTRVLRLTQSDYEYICDRDAGYTKGCGYRGKDMLIEHNYKLTWRLHWPAWQHYFGTSIEGAGVDHFTKGGSRDTLVEIFRQVFKAEPPIGYKYGFILFNGRKYSKSKGIGMGASDLLKLVPPELIKYMLLRPDLHENKDIVTSMERIMEFADDYNRALEKEPTNKSELKKAIAAKLSGGRQIPDIYSGVISFQVNGSSGTWMDRYYAEWVKRGLVPEQYRVEYKPSPTEVSRAFFALLKNDADPLTVHNSVFEFAEKRSMDKSALFSLLYQSLIGKEKGPRFGKLVVGIGISRIKKDFGIPS